VKYANYGLYVYNPGSSDINPTIANNTFAENTYGVRLYTSSNGNITWVIQNNTFTNNSYGLYTASHSSYTGRALPTVSNNDIFGNTQYGFLNSMSSGIVVVENNWWGDASGPYHPTTGLMKISFN
jgi:parallel beta-helix repeat protein